MIARSTFTCRTGNQGPSMTSAWPIGVFTSIDAGLGVHLDVVRELKIPSVQIHAPHAGNRTRQAAEKFLSKCADAGITITCVFGGFDGESYADIATTARTVGLVPEETRAARAREMKEISDFTRHLGCDTVALHIGFVPHDRDSKSYRGLLDCTRDLLDHVAANGQKLHLETGQETAAHLLDFIGDVGRDNLFINFDPANMILYGTGDPIAALRKVGHLVRSVHCKDARWAPADQRGKSWGTETPLGEGDVGMETYLRTLHDLGYTGPLTIEREIAHDRERQKADIGVAVRLLEQLRAKILGS
jgi:sugar phosphate isomerase/epimerase